MLMSASSDFVALCREQIALLTQGLGASLSVVYLTQELVGSPTGEAKLIPVVVYPETAILKQGEETAEVKTPKHMKISNVLALPQYRGQTLPDDGESSTSPQDSEASEEYLLSENQIVLPLSHEGVMMGLLVTGREDRAWNEQEQSQIQSIAQSLAIACILDQRRAWLQQQLQQQQILQEQQRDLLDNLLHQFRNPLTAIRTFGKLLMKRLRAGDPNRDVAGNIIRESDRLQELLLQFDQVVDLSEADLAPLPLPETQVVEATLQKESTKPPLLLPGTGEKEADCALAELLAPLLVSAKAIAQERNLQLITKIPRNLPLVRANTKALQEVLNNIIDNALKYTPAGGKIFIQVGQEQDNLQGIAISDTGPGIPSEDLAHIGERHYRGVQAQTDIPGTGLGLAIAKQLIEQMQGKIEVFSPAINSTIVSPKAPGTTFIIWLPEVEG
ncbi:MULTISPECIES: GAF domain-containing sensor histidine kinase [unclassified Tolypothrix]|uniref:GAF domain-containing sensor histidine kinase n=1 Tax=unclassified Tolypothrix TaxID=2649714 RepID=UPI0005EABE7A|nr:MULTISPECIES: GAF domain-containing sensor histidine kinase [unclassified Tolypothrix]BAY93520.1 GAF sensor signal transduction histidine kinase [Microchaete diplosiphon NIES-3275]EKE99408.1 sensor histidine kinase [Tolypothrix sp. PCC 7601]MBE9087247.1 GAF domain-containing sensor histidine kinase [Tolypothrix sp. LEGE 11397]UYD27358.1 GAF domain-containing sensor histidine kinase [Tolypothrix sp. PCC 7712]UYD36779.1 GAF domain-containing sensor histidine kinase [Tolypothrix sp. PCC 7601]